MLLLIGGVVSCILGLIGFFFWWGAFITILQGGLPIMLILGGVLAIYVGVDAMNDKIREERQKQDEKLEQAREEIERVKAQSQQYMEEIVKLKQQTKNASPQNE